MSDLKQSYFNGGLYTEYCGGNLNVFCMKCFQILSQCLKLEIPLEKSIVFSKRLCQ